MIGRRVNWDDVSGATARRRRTQEADALEGPARLESNAARRGEQLSGETDITDSLG
jgi:hypothetical protein